MCYCPTPTLHLNLALTGDGAFLLSPQKTHTVWFISVLNYGDTENVLINHLLLVIPMSYPCHYTNLCPHKPHKHAHTHTHTHTHTHSSTFPTMPSHTLIPYSASLAKNTQRTAASHQSQHCWQGLKSPKQLPLNVLNTTSVSDINVKMYHHQRFILHILRLLSIWKNCLAMWHHICVILTALSQKREIRGGGGGGLVNSIYFPDMKVNGDTNCLVLQNSSKYLLLCST